MRKEKNVISNSLGKRLFAYFVMAAAMICLSGCGKEDPPKPDDDEPRTEAIDGLFSVSATKQVQFAQGNLQYKESTSTWSFAKHQYDCVGGGNQYADTVYDEWIDLFGWGTGLYPSQTSTHDGDYAQFNDWGDHFDGGWRTLTIDEWKYVLNGRSGANSKHATGTVNGVHGLILLPDQWVLPNGCTFTPGCKEWDGNEYTEEQWKQMEAANAVFLPAAGIRWGTDVNEVGAYGYYWTSTPENATMAYVVFFNGSFINTESSCLRHGGIAVRLVREKE